MWPNALLIPLTHRLALLSNTKEHAPCSLQGHTVNILSLYPWLCFRLLLLDGLISLLNHKSFCKALQGEIKRNVTLFIAKIDSFPHCHSIHVIISQANSIRISDKYCPFLERSHCCLPVRQMGSVASLSMVCPFT